MASIFLAAFVLGAVSAPHCAAMCGPMAASAGCGGRRGAQYHLPRFMSLAVLGGLAGWMGETVVLHLEDSWAPTFISLTMALSLALAARRLWKEPRQAEPLVQLRAKSARWSMRSALTGALTPVLPCGAVWAGYLLAVGSASAWTGALAMLAFGLSSAIGVHAGASLLAMLGRDRSETIPWRQRAVAVAMGVAAVAVAMRPLDAIRASCHIP